MTTRAFKDLAGKYSKFPLNSAVNDTLLEMLELLFTDEEAQVAAKLSLLPLTAKKMARRVHRANDVVRSLLDSMADRGVILAFGDKDGDGRKYALMPIAPGIFEAQMSRAPTDEKARRFAELFEEYFIKENFEAVLKRKATTIKVVPIEKSLHHSIGVMHGDRFREAIDRHKTFALAHSCSCRHHKELIGDGCDRPKDVCMAFGKAAEVAVKGGFSRFVSREEMMAAIDRAEASALIHVTDNVENPYFCCNCCACCCGFVTIISKFNEPGIIANSRFVPEINLKACKACGKCTKACPVAALHLYGKKLIFEQGRCIGCGACVVSCKKSKALQMIRRPEHPGIPENYGQLFAQVGTEYFGIQRFTDTLPGFTRFLGNRLQSYLIKK